MSKYRFKITYRNENEYGQYWGDNRFTVTIIAETLEQAKQKLEERKKLIEIIKTIYFEGNKINIKHLIEEYNKNYLWFV